jgi:hypothetical protein
MAEAFHVASSSLISAGQIATLAEVGPSAVSNWRRRFEDFPGPVKEAPSDRDLFDLQEVRAWLEKRGKLRRGSDGKQLLFEAADRLRGEFAATSTMEMLGAALALAAVVQRQGGLADSELSSLISIATAADPSVEGVFESLRTVDRDTVDAVLDLVLSIDAAERPQSFEWLLARYDEQRGRFGDGSGEVQTAVLAALLSGEEGVVYDPCAGSGGFLLAAAKALRKGPGLFAQEANSATARIARQRFLVHGFPASVATGETLANDHWADLRADFVVCDPPYQMKRSWPSGAYDDPRWVLGPPPKVTDFAWLQQALYHLADDGRAYVFLPPGSLFRSGEEGNLRGRLLRTGAVEAVVSLPAGSAPQTGIPIVLWVLRRPEAVAESDSVLLLDSMASAPMSRAEFVADSIPQLTSLLWRWRKDHCLTSKDQTIAAAVRVEDLLAENANMVPARWIHQELSSEQREEQRQAFREGLAAAQKSRRAISAKLTLDPPPETSSTGWVTVESLVRDGLATIVRGASLKREDLLSSGVRVLRAQDLSAPGGKDRVHVSTKAASLLPLTEAGDVVISPVSGPIRAVVDREGGNVLASPLQALRLVDGVMDPEVVAAFLENERNWRFLTGSSYARLSVRDLEIPLLPPQDAAALQRALGALNDQERIALDLVSSAKELRRALVSLASPAEVGKEAKWRRSS